MIGERTGLRFRLVAIVVAAALLPSGPLAIALLLQVRDAIYATRVSDGRARLAAAAAAARQCGEDERCVSRTAQAAGARLVPLPCGSASASGGELVLCEPASSRMALELREDLRPVREELAALDRRLLLTLLLFVVLLLAAAVFLLERGVVRRLGLVDAALEAVGAEQGGPNLLPEGGDAVGRVGAAVNRLAQRLREERGRTKAQIEALADANRELRAAREEVHRSERLASVGRLAAGVAHEVGNPVSAVIGYAGLMRERLRQGKDAGDYAERIEREAARIDRILRDLLDLARPRALKLEPINLQRVAEEARVSAPKDLRVELALPADLPPAKGEEHYLMQVLVNLLSNAGRAGASLARIQARAEETSVVVEVIDDGSGIPPEALGRLFEPFFTTAPPGEGTGLGLALCHATMERIGGSISARNRSDRAGAIFELRFPKA